ncbi:TonB family protein [Palleronia sp. KMU-117]|uniref:TonB family protein n=1 Tax=Palleronia sp. KMU-117 TaxID=3434108 RepID=UPI003D754AD9
MSVAVATPAVAGGLRELALFGTLSLALHVGLFLQIAPGGGTDGSGAYGASAVTVEAADTALAALVAEWDRPPEALTEATAPAVETPAPAAPKLPPTAADRDPARTAPALPAPMASAAAPEAPTAPERPAAPPPPAVASVPPEVLPPLPDTRPAPRPAAQPAPSPVRAASPPQPVPPATPAAPHRASGSGDGQSAGRQAAGTGQSPSPERRAALQAEWSAAIQTRIARHQSYPAGNHGDGRVKVRMVIYPSGHLGEVTLAASSGRPALDAAALQAVRRAAPFPPAPAGLDDDWYQVAQWMSFRRR